MIIFHPLQKEDTRYLVDLFNEQFIQDPITEEILTEKIFLEEYYDSDLNFIVKNHNMLAGFASGVIREWKGKTIGWIKLLATIDQKKMGPILRETFHKIESKLLEKGAQTIRIFDSFPNYFTPGIDPHCTSLVSFLQQKGYDRRRDNVTMITDLTGQDFETLKKEEWVQKKYNITIRRAVKEDKEKILALITNDFPVWEPEIKIAFQKETNPLHIAVLNDRVIAFSNHSCNNTGKAWFGPMGTTEEARGKGLGEILLKRCLKDLQQEGHGQAVIPWVGPIGFYFQKCGAQVSRVYWNFIKEF